MLTHFVSLRRWALLVGTLLLLPALASPQTSFTNSHAVIAGHVNTCLTNPAGGTDSYTCALDSRLTALEPKACFGFVADVPNTGPASITFTGLGTQTIKKAEGGITTDLANNDIRAGMIVHVCWDGTNMQCQNCLGNAASGTPTTVADGDKGAITVTAGVWALDPLDLSTISLTGTLAQFNAAVSDANLVPEARTLTPSSPLAGGGDLSANRTLTCPTCTTNAAALTANQLVLGGGGQATSALGSLGTTTTVLHGNAAGAPTFGAVSLTADVAGTLPVASGGTNLTAAADDNLLVGNGTTWQAKAVPDCTDTGGNHLNYAIATNTFTCGTSGGVGGGVTTDTAQRAAFYNSTTTVDGAPALTFAADGTTINSMAPRITTRAASATLDGTDGPVVACTGGAADVTLTLPAGGPTSTQRTFTVVKVDAGVGQCLVKGNGTETINGSTGTLAASTQWSRVDVALAQTSGTPNWSGVQGKTFINLATDVGSTLLPVANLPTAARTQTKSAVIDAPTTADTNKVQWYFPAAVTLTRIACSISGTTSITIQLDERAEATPNTAGTTVLTSALVCDATSEASTAFTNATIAARVPLNLQLTAASGTPTALRVHLEYTID